MKKENIYNLIFKKFRKNIFAYNTKNIEDMLFKPNDALLVIDELEKLKTVIIGMDFWQYKNKDFIQVNSTDWSNINSGKDASTKTVEAARKLLKNNLLEDEEFVSFVFKKLIT